MVNSKRLTGYGHPVPFFLLSTQQAVPVFKRFDLAKSEDCW